MKKKYMPSALSTIVLLLLLTSLMFFGKFRSIISQSDIASGSRWQGYFMAMVIALSMFMVTEQSLLKKKHIPKIISIAVLFGFVGILSTAISGIYPLLKLPGQIILIFFWIGILIVSYYGSLRMKSINSLVLLVVMFLPLLFISFLRMVGTQTKYMLILNPVYYILFLLPFVLLVKSKIIKNIGILIIFAAIVLSYKRTGMIAYALCLLYYFGQTLIIKKNLSKKVAFCFFSLIVFFAGIYIYTATTKSYNIDWTIRAKTGGGIGDREYIWLTTIQALKNQDIFAWVLGSGYMSLYHKLTIWAHNDFLEVLYSYGIIGLLLYLWFIILLIKYSFKIKKENSEYGIVFGTSIVLFLICSMTSMLVILPMWFIYLPLFWGIMIGDYERKKADKEKNYIQVDTKQI